MQKVSLQSRQRDVAFVSHLPQAPPLAVDELVGGESFGEIADLIEGKESPRWYEFELLYEEK